MDPRRMPQYFSKSKPIHWTVGIMDMPDELFHKILRYIMHERVVPIDSRSSLSLDSFQPPPPSSSPEDAATIGKFKCVCKRWRELALEHQFTHIDTLATWGERSFSRLECFQRGDDPFTGEPNLAAKVTKFSLKVPVFYPQSEEQFSRLLGRTRDSIQNARQQLQAMLRTSTASNSRHRNATNQVRRELHQLIDDEKLMIDIMTRARDQQRTTTSGRDLQVLQQALSAFTSLRHIVLMSVWDATDGEWQKYLGKHRELADAFTPEWSDHGTRTLASAYQASGCTATRVSSRFMDAQIPMSLTNGSEEALARLAVRMTTLRLELRFNRPEQLENKMFQLSPLFRKVFEAAINLQAVHIEFTKQAKVSIPLETVFHDVRWPRIRVIGVAHWRLNSDEIIDLVRRHRRTLKGLRLRDVYLKSGSRWDDILRVVRSEMKILGWLSLTRSNYEAWEDSHTPLVGFPVNDSDDVSDESYEGDEVEDENSAEPADYSSDSEMSDEIDMEHPNGEQGDDSDTSSDDYDHHEGSDSESDAGTAVYDTSMEEQVQRHPLPLQCHCHRGYEPTADLHDDGIQVTKDQRIYWQQWVVGRCRIHDPQV